MTDPTPEEEAQWAAWEARAAREGTIAFRRIEMRRSKRQRTLDCHHRIDPREPYRYEVWKIYGEPGVQQMRICDFCMRRDHRY